MIAVGMGAEDCGDALSFHGAQNGLDMALAIYIRWIADTKAASCGAWIDYRDILASANNPSLRASECIWRRVRRQHAAHQRLMLLAISGLNCIGPFVLGHPSPYGASAPKGKGAGVAVTCPLPSGWQIPVDWGPT
jgi:hypothetical protein